MRENEYCRVFIKSILELDHIPFDVYIKLSDDKIIRYSNKDDDVEQLCKYQDRGVDYVWAKKVEFEKFTKYLNNSLAKKFFKYNGSTLKNGLLETIRDDFELVENNLKKIGIRQSELNNAQELAIKALSRVSMDSELYQLLTDLEDESKETYLNCLMTGVTSNRILDNFNWQTAAIKEKLVFASLLSKVGMTNEELSLIKEWERGNVLTEQLNVNIKEKSQEIIAKIREKVDGSFASEIVTILSQSYELPDGSGFPRGVASQNIVLLSCIYVVAKNFVLEMDAADFDPDKKKGIIENLLSRFDRGNYKKVIDSLEASF